VLLGTGGLVRAYTKAAKAALENAGIMRMDKWGLIQISCTYSMFERISKLITDSGGHVRSCEYGADVAIIAMLPNVETDLFLSNLSQLTSARAKAEIIGVEFMGILISGSTDNL
jgi:putative IMPACT (imprinted ancient) family translation regulator